MEKNRKLFVLLTAAGACFADYGAGLHQGARLHSCTFRPRHIPSHYMRRTGDANTRGEHVAATREAKERILAETAYVGNLGARDVYVLRGRIDPDLPSVFVGQRRGRDCYGQFDQNGNVVVGLRDGKSRSGDTRRVPPLTTAMLKYCSQRLFEQETGPATSASVLVVATEEFETLVTFLQAEIAPAGGPADAGSRRGGPPAMEDFRATPAARPPSKSTGSRTPSPADESGALSEAERLRARKRHLAEDAERVVQAGKEKISQAKARYEAHTMQIKQAFEKYQASVEHELSSLERRHAEGLAALKRAYQEKTAEIKKELALQTERVSTALARQDEELAGELRSIGEGVDERRGQIEAEAARVASLLDAPTLGSEPVKGRPQTTPAAGELPNESLLTPQLTVPETHASNSELLDYEAIGASALKDVAALQEETALLEARVEKLLADE